MKALLGSLIFSGKKSDDEFSGYENVFAILIGIVFLIAIVIA
tara:strand:- start:573 stop:698 length:126 start_codon:yes stop_codon:yes gene_type:complete